MPYSVSLTLPTPKELAEATQAARESTWGMRYPPRRPAPLPGWIRVQFYSHLYRIRHEMLPDMEGEVMLHPSGGLDTRRVCKLWNLEECTPIDPMRWIPFERSEPNWLSPLAVSVLSEQNKCIKFIEPAPPSPTTFHKRTFRQATVHLYTSVCLFSQLSYSLTATSASSCVHLIEQGALVIKRPWDWLDERTKIPEWLGYLVIALYFVPCWLLTQAKNSRPGVLAQSMITSCSTSCGNGYRAIMHSWRMQWVKEQMLWIVLLFCLAMLMGGVFLLFGAFESKTMVLADVLRQPSAWARKGANGGIVGAHAESMWIM